MYAIRIMLSISLVCSTRLNTIPLPLPLPHPSSYSLIYSLLWILLKRPVLHSSCSNYVWCFVCIAQLGKNFFGRSKLKDGMLQVPKMQAIQVGCANLSKKHNILKFKTQYTQHFLTVIDRITQKLQPFFLLLLFQSEFNGIPGLCLASNYKIVNLVSGYRQLKPKIHATSLHFPSNENSSAILLDSIDEHPSNVMSCLWYQDVKQH